MAKYSFRDAEDRLVSEGWQYCAVVQGSTSTTTDGTEKWFLKFIILFSPTGDAGRSFGDSIWWNDKEWRIDSLMGAAFPEKVGSDEEIEVVAEDLEGKEMWVRVSHREFEGEKYIRAASFRPADRPPRDLAEAFEEWKSRRKAEEEPEEEDETEDPIEEL